MNRESYFLNRYSLASIKHARYRSWSKVVGKVPRFALEAIAFGGIIVYSLFLLMTQEDARQIFPVVGLFAFAGYRLMPAMQDIFTSLTEMRHSQKVLDHIHYDIMNGFKVEDLDNISHLRCTHFSYRKSKFLGNPTYRTQIYPKNDVGYAI